MRLCAPEPGNPDLAFTKGLRVRELRELLGEHPDNYVVTVNHVANLALMMEDGVTQVGCVDMEDASYRSFDRCAPLLRHDVDEGGEG